MEKNIISQQFHLMAKEYPQRTALKCGEYIASYEEMRKQVQIISNNLRKNGVKAGDLVAICLPHSEVFVLSVMAVLECGATYVPMEYSTPDGRIRMIVENNNINWIIGKREHKVDANMLMFDSLMEEDNDCAFAKQKQSENDSAYIIFTSGSTGVPKGIEIRNYSVCQLVKSYGKYLYSDEMVHQVLLMASFCFDMSVFQMFYPLLTGQTLVVLPDFVKENPLELLAYIKKHKITVMDVTPLYLEVIMDCMESGGEYSIPKYIVSSGEALPIMTAKRWFQNAQCKDSTIFNSYGPTEACVYASVFEINQNNIEGMDKMVIGKPLDGYQIYILNEKQKVCGVEEAGELYIVGTGLAKGYRNLEELTSQSFIQKIELFGGQRLYRTGDFGYYTKEGMLVYLGRGGDQVKIHGYRIELGEIEYQMQRIPGITKCRVIAEGEGKEKKIVAYFVAEQNYVWQAEEFDEQLQEVLPHYMIPSCYVPVDGFKKTERGKLDRRSLPDYRTNMLKRKRNHTTNAVCDAIFYTVVEMCKHILNVNDIEPEYSFLEHGGTSIHYFSLSAKIQSEFDVMIRPSELMKLQDIYSISNMIRQFLSNVEENMTKEKSSLTKAGTTAFQRLLFTEEKKTQKLVKKYGMDDFPMYNVIYSVYFDEPMDENRFRTALEQVIKDNDAFRSCVVKSENNLYEMQIQETNIEDCYEVRNVENVLDEEVVRSAIDLFDISVTPLFKITMLKDDHRQRFVMNFHHAIFDYCSMRIFMEELLHLYYGKKREKTGSFLGYIEEVNQSNKEESLQFWKDYYRDRKPCVFLPGDISQNGKHNMNQFVTKRFRIENEQYEQICEHCKKVGMTVYGYMFARFANQIMQLTQSEDVVIGTYMNSRDVEALTNLRTIGLITSMVGIRFQQQEGVGEEFVKNVDQNLKAVSEHLSLEYNEVYEIMDEKDLIQGKLFDIVFNYIVQGTVYDGISEHEYFFEEIGEEPISLPLSLKGFEDAKGITFKLKYCSEIYSQEYVDRFVKQYMDCVTDIVKEGM